MRSLRILCICFFTGLFLGTRLICQYAVGSLGEYSLSSFPNTPHHLGDAVFYIDLFVNIKGCTFNFKKKARDLTRLKKEVIEFIRCKKSAHRPVEEGGAGFSNFFLE